MDPPNTNNLPIANPADYGTDTDLVPEASLENDTTIPVVVNTVAPTASAATVVRPRRQPYPEPDDPAAPVAVGSGLDRPQDQPAQPQTSGWPRRWRFIGLGAAILVGGGALIFLRLNHQAAPVTTGSINDQYANTAIPADQLQDVAGLTLTQSEKQVLSVNGQLNVSNDLVLSPSGAPGAPVAGQIYYDQAENVPRYYNGSSFVDLGSSVTTIINTTNPQLPAVTPTTINNQGGNFTIGSGLLINNSVVSVDRYAITSALSVETIIPNLHIVSDGNGHFSIASDTGSGFLALAPATAQTDPSINPSIYVNKTGVGNIIQLQGGGTDVFSVDDTGQAYFRTAADSVNGFQIQNAGGTSILTVDTAQGRIGLNNPTPTYALDVNGDINSNSALLVGGISLCTISGCIPANGSQNYIQNSTVSQDSANFNIRSAASNAVTAVLQGTIGQTANVLEIQGWNGTSMTLLDSFAANGALAIKTATNTGYALAVRNSANQLILNVSTSTSFVSLNAFVSITGNMQATGNVYAGGVLTVSGGSSLNGTTSIYGNTTVNSNYSFTALGTAVFQNAAASPAAFQVNNVSGTQIINVDNTPSSSLPSVNIAWTTTTGPPSALWSGTGGFVSPAASYNGYVYAVGHDTRNVAYAPLNTNGSIGSWTTSPNKLPSTVDSSYARSVAYNGKLYVAGISGSSPYANVIYYTTLNADGSFGAWQTNAATPPYPAAAIGGMTINSNGYMYLATSNSSNLYYGHINADGSISAWQAQPITVAGGWMIRYYMTSHGNFIYLLDPSNNPNMSYYAQINPDGSFVWKTLQLSGLPAYSLFGLVIYQDYVYTIASDSGPTNIYLFYAQINPDGSFGQWQRAKTAIAFGGWSGKPTMQATWNNYIYLLNSYWSVLTSMPHPSLVSTYAGNLNLSAAASLTGTFLLQNTVDSLTEFQIKNASNSSILTVNSVDSAISINGATAITGNTSITGTLAVSGAATLSGGLTIYNSSNFYGSLYIGANTTVTSSLTATNTATFKKSSASATAFQVQNTAGNNILTVDTVQGQVVLGTSSTVAGSLVFKNAASTGSVILQGPTSLSSDYTLTIPTLTANDTLCTNGQASSCYNYAPATGSNNYIRNNNPSSTSKQTNANIFIQAGNGIVTAKIQGDNGGANIMELYSYSDAINPVVAFNSAGNLTFGQASTIGVVDAAAGTNLSLRGGNATSGTNVGGNLVLQGGAGAATGYSGSVIVRSNTNNAPIAFQVQDAGSAGILTVNSTNATVTVTNLVVLASLTVNGHLVSGGSAPTIAAGSAACTLPPGPSVNGTDTAGLITMTTGTDCTGGGILASLTFSTAYDTPPSITLTPANAAAAGLANYIDDATATTGGFSIATTATPNPGTVYKYYYQVIQ